MRQIRQAGELAGSTGQTKKKAGGRSTYHATENTTLRFAATYLAHFGVHRMMLMGTEVL